MLEARGLFRSKDDNAESNRCQKTPAVVRSWVVVRPSRRANTNTTDIVQPETPFIIARGHDSTAIDRFLSIKQDHMHDREAAHPR